MRFAESRCTSTDSNMRNAKAVTVVTVREVDPLPGAQRPVHCGSCGAALRPQIRGLSMISWSRMARRIYLPTLGALLFLSAGARAQDTAVAILEEINGASGKHGAFDELKVGDRIDLGAGGSAIIGYLDSCVRETIQGGTVTIAAGQSKIDGGKVTRETIACEATQLVLSEEEAGKSATVAFRGPPWEDDLRQVVPSPSPLVLAPGKQLAIKRLDGDEPAMNLPLKDGKVDLAAQNVSLTPGGFYELTAGKKQTVIKIDPDAQAGPLPAMSRLVRL